MPTERVLDAKNFTAGNLTMLTSKEPCALHSQEPRGLEFAEIKTECSEFKEEEVSLIDDQFNTENIITTNPAIAANDIGGLLEQFLQYEKDATCVPGEEAHNLLTPAASPKDDGIPLENGNTSLTLHSEKGIEVLEPTPPITPTNSQDSHDHSGNRSFSLVTDDSCTGKANDELNSDSTLQAKEMDTNEDKLPAERAPRTTWKAKHSRRPVPSPRSRSRSRSKSRSRSRSPLTSRYCSPSRVDLKRGPVRNGKSKAITANRSRSRSDRSWTNSRSRSRSKSRSRSRSRSGRRSHRRRNSRSSSRSMSRSRSRSRSLSRSRSRHRSRSTSRSRSSSVSSVDSDRCSTCSSCSECAANNRTRLKSTVFQSSNTSTKREEKFKRQRRNYGSVSDDDKMYWSHNKTRRTEPPARGTRSSRSSPARSLNQRRGRNNAENGKSLRCSFNKNYDEDVDKKMAELAAPVPYDIEKERKLKFLLGEERDSADFKRRNVYAGGIPSGSTKRDIERRFDRFGPIDKITLHFREKGDNYAFIVFHYAEDAARAIREGNDDPYNRKLDLCFGGRRKFVGGSYVDFDGNASYLHEIDVRASQKSRSPTPEMDFDSLLKMARKEVGM